MHDTCFDGEICDDEGVCKTANGEACTENDACASGVCVEGLCCDRPCDGSCALCDDPSSPGICIDRACGAYTCDTDHEALECFESCSDSSQCAADHQCIADGRCVAIDTTAAPQVVDGCSCRTGQSSAGGWLVAAIAFLGWSRRRQRRSP